MNIKDEIEKNKKETERLEALLEAFPDLVKTKDRWGTIRYAAASANNRVTDVEMRHSCGCCPEATYLALPYLEYEGSIVYSKPERFGVGERSYRGFKHDWYETWEQEMRNANISEAVIKKISEIQTAEEAEPDEEDED